MRARDLKVVCCAVAALLVGLVAAPVASAAGSVPITAVASKTWDVEGYVYSTATAGDRIVVGGVFDRVEEPGGTTHPASNLAIYNPQDGTFDTDWFPSVNGSVDAIAVAGDTVYIGGKFNRVGDTRRRYLAALSLTDGSVLSWSPATSRPVGALAAVNGYVYIGGNYTSLTDPLGTRATSFLARVSGTSGVEDITWNQSLALNDQVRVIQPTPDGRWVYVGGNFTSLGPGRNVTKLAKLSTDATATSDPTFRSQRTSPDGNPPVYALDLAGNDLLLAAGGRGGTCALQDASTGQTRWTYHTNGNVVAAAIIGSEAACGGHFNGDAAFDGLSRTKLAFVDLRTAEIDETAIRVDSALGIFAMRSTAVGLFVGGEFRNLGQVPQSGFGEFRLLGNVTEPAAPRGVFGQSDAQAITVFWSPPSTDGGAEVKSYVVLRQGTTGQYEQIGTTRSMSFRDASASPGQAYQYVVRAVNSVGTGSGSDPIQLTGGAGQQQTPSAPTDLTATSSETSVTLYWDPPVSDGGQPVTSYNVYRRADDGNDALVASVNRRVTTYQDSGLSTGRTYGYSVAAVNSLGEGERTSVLFVTPSEGVPGTPTLTVTAGSNGTMQASWVPGSGPAATRYALVRDNIRVATVKGATSYTDTGLTPGQSYVYRVRAVNASGNSPLSNSVTVVALP